MCYWIRSVGTFLHALTIILLEIRRWMKVQCFRNCPVVVGDAAVDLMLTMLTKITFFVCIRFQNSKIFWAHVWIYFICFPRLRRWRAFKVMFWYSSLLFPLFLQRVNFRTHAKIFVTLFGLMVGLFFLLNRWYLEHKHGCCWLFSLLCNEEPFGTFRWLSITVFSHFCRRRAFRNDEM